MKSALLLLAMALLLLAGSVTISVGQGGGNSPTQFQVTVDDPDCSGGPACGNAPDANCASAQFYVPSNGTYSFTASMVCADGVYCKYCLACAWVTRDDGVTVICGPVHSTCQESGCTAPSAGQCQNLLAGTPYRLVVCKRHCDLATCDDCPASCTAHAKLTD